MKPVKLFLKNQQYRKKAGQENRRSTVKKTSQFNDGLVPVKGLAYAHMQ